MLPGSTGPLGIEDIRVYRDGVLEATTPDTNLVDGKLGFGSKDCRAGFDDLTAY